MRQIVEIIGFKVEVLLIGNGTHPVIAFHGFGREASDFNSFAPVLNEDEFLISINLFQHGASSWPEDRSFSSSLRLEEHTTLIEEILRRFAPESRGMFSIMAYSMGGRVALSTVQLLPDRIKQVLLIAPDGLKVNQLYRFAAGTSLGQALYRKIITTPEIIFFPTNMAHRTGLISAKLHRFVHVHMNTEEKRRLVYEAWLIYREFQPDLQRLARIIPNSSMLGFKMLFGAYDSVIKPEWGQRFAEQIGDHKMLHLIPSGHQLMNENTAEFVAERGLWR